MSGPLVVPHLSTPRCSMCGYSTEWQIRTECLCRVWPLSWPVICHLFLHSFLLFTPMFFHVWCKRMGHMPPCHASAATEGSCVPHASCQVIFTRMTRHAFQGTVSHILNMSFPIWISFPIPTMQADWGWTWGTEGRGCESQGQVWQITVLASMYAISSPKAVNWHSARHQSTNFGPITNAWSGTLRREEEDAYKLCCESQDQHYTAV